MEKPYLSLDIKHLRYKSIWAEGIRKFNAGWKADKIMGRKTPLREEGG